MNEVLKTIKKRYSCRDFSGMMPTNEMLDMITEAALEAPSGMNMQPWKIIIIKNKELLNDMDKEGMYNISKMDDKTLYDRMMSRGGNLFYNAPCMYFILKKPNTDLDCGIITQNIAIAATSLELGSLICGLVRMCFLGSRNEEFKIRLGIPEGYELGMAVLVGEARADRKPHDIDLSKVAVIE